jgi:UDP-3-O-[3-hydroxymyristoyl] N-acetylglucosamine deacetylase
VRRVNSRPQRTVARSAEVVGIGFLSGATVRLRFVPAPPDTGLIFVRTDLPRRPHLPARVEYVTATNRRTTLGQPPLQVTLVEHVLAALAGLRIDNCYLEIDGDEPPGLDGSARRFVDVLRDAGVVSQRIRRPIWAVEETVAVEHNGATLALHPPVQEELRASYLLDYGPRSPIGWQIHTRIITPESFINDLAHCRTFLLHEEAVMLRQQGLGARVSEEDLLVFGRSGPINNPLRHADEPARHKLLDMVGDLSLLGHDVRGHLVAYRSGHPLNVMLVRELRQRLPRPQELSVAA